MPQDHYETLANPVVEAIVKQWVGIVIGCSGEVHMSTASINHRTSFEFLGEDEAAQGMDPLSLEERIAKTAKQSLVCACKESIDSKPDSYSDNVIGCTDSTVCSV